jgi:hypothetical protein
MRKGSLVFRAAEVLIALPAEDEKRGCCGALARSEVSMMTMIDVHAHFLSDFYRDALLVVGVRQADGITKLPA